MSSILMDRWSIENVLRHLGGDLEKFYAQEYEGNFNKTNEKREKGLFEKNKQCWENFLVAIVLWDEIWSCHKTLDRCWEKIFNSQQQEIAVSMKKLIYQVESTSLDQSLNSVYNNLLSGVDENVIDISEANKQRTAIYQLISNSLGVPYFAHPSRGNLQAEDLFTRFDLIERVDKELLQYYEKVNTTLGRKLLKFDYPVLMDFIRREAQTPTEELIRAVELRVDKDIVTFRNQLYETEQSIVRGDTQKILSELKMVSDLANDITNKYQKNTSLGEMSISLTPSISLPLNVSKNQKHCLHATFIRRLMRYGVYERTEQK